MRKRNRGHWVRGVKERPSVRMSFKLGQKEGGEGEILYAKKLKENLEFHG